MRACMSYRLCSRTLSRDSTGSGIGSTGAPAGGPDGTLGVENESLWISACREARRLISRSPTKSPRLKLPFPCLNSQSGESGEPVWNTSLTAPRRQYGLAAGQMSNVRVPTFVKAIHVQLAHERGNVGVLEVRPASPVSYIKSGQSSRCTYDRTLEKSLEGDMTKLSLLLDHEMRCWMLWSSSMLRRMR